MTLTDAEKQLLQVLLIDCYFGNLTDDLVVRDTYATRDLFESVHDTEIFTDWGDVNEIPIHFSVKLTVNYFLEKLKELEI